MSFLGNVEWWCGRNVLITGISGFVGSALSKHLSSLGANVVGIVKSIQSGTPWGRVAAIEIGDITDYKFLREVISAHEIEYIFHFAAYAIVRISARDPMSAYNVNIMGTVALLEAARNVGRCKAIVVASSDKAYGDHFRLPYEEDFPLQPKNTYDTSKACMDMIARSYAANYGMPITVTRCSNIYGPGDMNISRIIPNTIKRITDLQKPLLYSDIEKMEREFIYIDDVIRAYDGIAKIENHEGDAFNIGGTGPIAIRELIEKICTRMRVSPDMEIVDREDGFKEIQKQYIDSGKLWDRVGWQPKVFLDEGLEETVRWYKTLFSARNR